VQKLADQIKIQFGMWTRVGSANMYYMGMQTPPREVALLVVSGRLETIVKHSILGVGYNVELGKKKWLNRS